MEIVTNIEKFQLYIKAIDKNPSFKLFVRKEPLETLSRNTYL